MKTSRSLFSLIIWIIIFTLVTQVRADVSTLATIQTDVPPPTPALPLPESTLEPLIVGGGLASPGEFPWQVALVTASEPNPYAGQFCGGSLISSGWVLTAAHCVVNSNGVVSIPEDIDIVLGINNLGDGPTHGSQGQRIKVSQVIPHPGFSFRTKVNDVALIRLAHPATLGGLVKTIPMAGAGDSALFNPGVMATVSGWGSTSEGGLSSNALRKVSLPVVSNTICNEAYKGSVKASMLCAGYASGGKNSCQGDSGGPFIVADGRAGWIQAGIVSWGNGCGHPDSYGVYTRLASFKSWISSIVFIPPHVTYLPILLNDNGSTPQECVASQPGESNNISDALTICSGQTVSGQVSKSIDRIDVYKIYAEMGRFLTITLTGSGNDADLYLCPPSATDVTIDPNVAYSENNGTNELIQYITTVSGNWYVSVFAYEGTINYDLKVAVTP